jgi:hypothetical protein
VFSRGSYLDGKHFQGKVFGIVSSGVTEACKGRISARRGGRTSGDDIAISREGIG